MTSVDGISHIPISIGSLTDQEKDMIQQFLTRFQQMDQLQRSNTHKYLSSMIDCSRASLLSGKQQEKASVIFSYPERGHPNDGNPALKSIVQLIRAGKLTVKENEYTKQKAIWLCEDFKVSWKPKNNHAILTNALEQIGKLEF